MNTKRTKAPRVLNNELAAAKEAADKATAEAATATHRVTNEISAAIQAELRGLKTAEIAKSDAKQAADTAADNFRNRRVEMMTTLANLSHLKKYTLEQINAGIEAATTAFYAGANDLSPNSLATLKSQLRLAMHPNFCGKLERSFKIANDAWLAEKDKTEDQPLRRAWKNNRFNMLVNIARQGNGSEKKTKKDGTVVTAPVYYTEPATLIAYASKAAPLDAVASNERAAAKNALLAAFDKLASLMQSVGVPEALVSARATVDAIGVNGTTAAAAAATAAAATAAAVTAAKATAAAAAAAAAAKPAAEPTEGVVILDAVEPEATDDDQELALETARALIAIRRKREAAAAK